MKQFIALCALLVSFSSVGQLNMDSLGRLDYFPLHTTNLNDVWGYVDEMGNEYALVGAEKGTGIVDVTDPTNPTELFWEVGQTSIWRDLKTWGDYAYVTTEAQNGLLIIDMSPLPGSTSLPVSYYNGPAGSEWASAHNLYIDEFGYAYIFGANRGNGGVIMLDVHTDPMNPIEVGVFDDWYVHDGYAQNDTLYLGHISDGFMSIVNVADKANPVLLGTAMTPSTFTHNIWTTDNGKYAFTTDEVSDGYIGAYDVTDPANIIELDRIQSSPGMGIIPHNTHVLNNHIITSYYSDGVTVHDVTYPYNMVEVGHYDTYPLQTMSYDGCWGAYPYLPSGNILATDRSEGLFILGPNYIQGAYLEGIVTDAVTLNPIDLVDVQIQTSVQLENTNATGFYAAGMASPGTYDVSYEKVGYYPQTISVSLSTGVITNQDVQLVPIPPYTIDVNVVEEGTGLPISGAEIWLSVPQLSHTGATNGLGDETLTLYYEDTYKFIVGKWGYITYCDDPFIDSSTGTLTVELKKGYYDDFAFDFGWAMSGSAVTGAWERGVPYATNVPSTPDADVTNDCGEMAMITGNLDTMDADADDVDDGNTVVISPVMDLSNYTDPYVNYTRWFHCYHGPQTPDDSLRVFLHDGTSIVVIDAVGSVPPDSVDWVEKSIRISDYLTPTSTMQVSVRTSDLSGAANITEGGFDRFFVVEESQLSTDQLESTDFIIYPNPVENLLTIDGVEGVEQFVLVGTDGSIILQGEVTKDSNQINVENVSRGYYFLNIGGAVHKMFKVN